MSSFSFMDCIVMTKFGLIKNEILEFSEIISKLFNVYNKATFLFPLSFQVF